MLIEIDSPLRLSRPKIGFSNETYLLKLAETDAELRSVLALRSSVFKEEYGLTHRSGVWDIDDFDGQCDHLVVIERSSGEVVATYRLMNTVFHRRFYSQSEFDLSLMMALPGEKVELGRSCVKREARNGIALTLLWRGIASYAKQVGARWLFGCVSFKTEGLSDAAALYRHFYRRIPGLDCRVEPQSDYRMVGLEEALVQQCEMASPHSGEAANLCERIPSLAEAYLKAGAKIISPPAHDRDFKCIDFLALLDLHQLNPRFARKFSCQMGAQ